MIGSTPTCRIDPQQQGGGRTIEWGLSHFLAETEFSDLWDNLRLVEPGCEVRLTMRGRMATVFGTG